MRFLALAALLVGGCGKFTHFQTGRVLDPGAVQWHIEGASTALKQAPHNAFGVRVGLPVHFEVGGEVDLFSLAAADEGVRVQPYLVGDLKYQLLHEAEDGQGWSPVSLAVGAGGGRDFFNDFWFYQGTVSRRFDAVEPYVAYRRQRLRIDIDPKDPEDLDLVQDSFFEKLFEEAGTHRIRMNHLILGLRIHTGGGWFFSPEVSWIGGDARGMASIGLAFGKAEQTRP